MHHSLQFGMRGNPASDRRRGSREVVRSFSDEHCIEKDHATSPPPTTGRDHLPADARIASYAASPRAATGDESGGPPTHQGVSVLAGSHPKIQREFEPLIGSCEAARLLGNIHVKTLQRYARRGSLPGYQIGGHWYFRASELDSWLHSQLNLSCHPCRLQEESDGT
jgi:excisionase family DNA binding protein